ncbi:MAG: hypothetical protein OXE53_12205 [Deltaproteobacteria bacterium]|nr:hypothetical protein [Deltaproteobacteria bacterium]
MSALEAIEDASLSFSRRGVAAWDGTWLLPLGRDTTSAAAGP